MESYGTVVPWDSGICAKMPLLKKRHILFTKQVVFRVFMPALPYRSTDQKPCWVDISEHVVVVDIFCIELSAADIVSNFDLGGIFAFVLSVVP